MVDHIKGTETRPYELSAISTNLSDTEIVGFIERVKKILTNAAAEVKSEATPLRARLSYPIRKTPQGVYFFIRFAALPSKVKEIMHDLRLMPEMLRPHIDALASFEEKKPAVAPAVTMADAKTAPRGWTKREDSPETAPAVAAMEEKVVEAPIEKTAAEEKVTMEDLDKRLDEILGKNSSL